jgi:hypothetical protein
MSYVKIFNLKSIYNLANDRRKIIHTKRWKSLVFCPLIQGRPIIRLVLINGLFEILPI